MASRLVSSVRTMGTARGCSIKYFCTFFLGSRTSTARTMRPLLENSLATSSTMDASSSQYLHHVVQNSNRTILPLMDALLYWSPVVVLARKRGAGWPVSSAAKARRHSSATKIGNERRRAGNRAGTGREVNMGYQTL